jgi:hypothetical protein
MRVNLYLVVGALVLAFGASFYILRPVIVERVCAYTARDT